MKEAAIKTNIYKPHSTRQVSSSKLKLPDIPITVILAKGGWSLTLTFRKHDGPPILDESAVRIDTNDNIKKRKQETLVFMIAVNYS